MKSKSMTSLVAKSVAVLAACAALNASAGTAPAKGPVPPVEPEPASLFDTVGATLDVGFDSRYYFRGLWFSDNIAWSALNLSVPIIGGSSEDAGSLTWNLGAVYISNTQTPFGNPTNNSFDYSELDLITSLSYDAGFAKFGLQYQYYYYPDTYAGSFAPTGGAYLPNAANDPEFGISGAGEVGFTVAIPIKALNLYFGAYYDFQIGGSYYQAAADYTIGITDWLSLVPAFQVGYGVDYYTGNGSASSGGNLVNNVGQSKDTYPTSGFTHTLATLSAPIKLTKIATFTPYVAWNHSLDLRTGLNATTHNEVFWGAKLSVAF